MQKFLYKEEHFVLLLTSSANVENLKEKGMYNLNVQPDYVHSGTNDNLTS